MGDGAVMMNNKKTLLRLNLRFFDEGEKTEKATPRKKQKAREEGQVAKSQEIGTAVLFIAAFLCLRLFGAALLENLMELFHYQLTFVPQYDNVNDPVFLSNFIAWLFMQIIILVLPFFAVMMVLGLLTSIVQVGWHPTSKPMKPKFSKMNPLKGIKRIFSMQGVITLVKSLLKLAVIVAVIYGMMGDQINLIPSLLDLSLEQSTAFIGNMIVDMGILVGELYIFIAAIDYAYTRYKHNKDLKMTKHEVKEEYKQTEGNPQIKGRIKQKMREVSMRRMMQNVPKADVIITNPTHYAVALKYDLVVGGAPVLVAKGVDYQAKRIKDVGKEHGIEIVESPPLARAIYNDVQIDQEIPPELYEAVAEILAYVYRLRNRVAPGVA
jgi:flagellar biosynthetic protein FlhB